MWIINHRLQITNYRRKLNHFKWWNWTAFEILDDCFFSQGANGHLRRGEKDRWDNLKLIVTVTVINVTIITIKIVFAMILIIHRMSIGSRDLSWRHKEGLLLPENKMMYADSSIGEGMDITIQVASRAWWSSLIMTLEFMIMMISITTHVTLSLGRGWTSTYSLWGSQHDSADHNHHNDHDPYNHDLHDDWYPGRARGAGGEGELHGQHSLWRLWMEKKQGGFFF